MPPEAQWYIEVSPPTRGWTPYTRPHSSHSSGFPAHAGMDPRMGYCWMLNVRFPRPRGDGPHVVSRMKSRAWVSPPTRGWTPREVWRHGLPNGFPAHAGMDHCTASLGTTRPGFPRPRGDGPSRSFGGPPTSPVSPPTRGWTDITLCIVETEKGFPAHAGMDPATWASLPTRTWFPRPRGDGPQERGGLLPAIGVSPPTRGWTHHRPAHAAGLRGFPAHAGMDLSTLDPASPEPRFPRPRGDGPAFFTRIADLVEVSPPTRGWTPHLRGGAGGRRGFPAHAGMDPKQTIFDLISTGFPRPRGDGPINGTLHNVVPKVSPPTRGWTSSRSSGRWWSRGFPAHAGMDRTERATSSRRTGFPRPRGDGP